MRFGVRIGASITAMVLTQHACRSIGVPDLMQGLAAALAFLLAVGEIDLREE